MPTPPRHPSPTSSSYGLTIGSMPLRRPPAQPQKTMRDLQRLRFTPNVPAWILGSSPRMTKERDGASSLPLQVSPAGSHRGTCSNPTRATLSRSGRYPSPTSSSYGLTIGSMPLRRPPAQPQKTMRDLQRLRFTPNAPAWILGSSPRMTKERGEASSLPLPGTLPGHRGNTLKPHRRHLERVGQMPPPLRHPMA